MANHMRIFVIKLTHFHTPLRAAESRSLAALSLLVHVMDIVKEESEAFHKEQYFL